MTALAASDPLFGLLLVAFSHLWRACFIFKAVIIPFPIGLLNLIERVRKKFDGVIYHDRLVISLPKGFIANISLGNKVRTDNIASNMAIPVKIPK